MHVSKRIFMTLGGALLAVGASLFAIGQTVSPVNSGLNVGSANVCPSGQTTPAPCSQTATVTFKFTAGGSIAKPAVLTQGAPNLDLTDAKTGTCTSNGTSHVYTANDTCTVDVKFAPRYPGQSKGAVEILNSSGNLLAIGYVSGTGVGPLATFENTTSSAYLPSAQINLGSGFGSPDGVAVDASGNVFVADWSLNAVKEIVAVNGSIPASPTIKTLGSYIDRPWTVTVDGAGNIFVGDNSRHMNEIVAAGGYTTMIPLGVVDGAASTAVDGSGNLFATEYNTNGRVHEFVAADGYTTDKILGSGFHFPAGLTVDGSGNVFVADQGDNAVKEILAAGGYTTVITLASGLTSPWGVAVDASGNVFVSSVKTPGDHTTTNVVWEIPAAGGYTTVKILGRTFNRPNGVAVDGNGNVFIADTGSGRVLKLNYADPPSLAFANASVGVESSDSPQTVTIANNGNQHLDILGLSYGKDFPEAPDVSTDCTTSISLATGESCTLSIDFSPLAASVTGASTPLSEAISLTDNNLNRSATVQSIGVQGTVTVPPPAITSPMPGITLSGSSATFHWSAGFGPTAYLLMVGTTGAGSSDVYLGNSTTSLSAAVSGIPTYSETLYVRLKYQVNATWIGVDYTYTEGDTPPPPVMTSPASGGPLGGSSATFKWSSHAYPWSYILNLGTNPGSHDVYNGAVTLSTSATVSNLPTNGVWLYARLYYGTGSSSNWQHIDYTYAEAGTLTPPALTAPAPGSTLTGSDATFTWNPGSGARKFMFKLGTSPGRHDVYNGDSTTSTSAAISNIPTHAGVLLYARLYYAVNATWQQVDCTYTEAGALTPPALTTPTPGSTLTGSSVTFTWSPGGGPRTYILRVGGNGVGSSDIYNGSKTTVTTVSLTNIPTNGKTVYVRLLYLINNTWSYIDYTYKAQ